MPAPPSNLTHAEARERGRLVEGLAYFIEWDLTGEEGGYQFQTQVEFSSGTPGASTFIDLEVEQVAEMAWNGSPLPTSAYDGRRIALPPLSSRNSLMVRGRAVYERTGLGLHRSIDPVDGTGYVYSDFQPYEAHRSFPCFDQPDLKGSFRFRIRVPEEWLVVGCDPGQPEEIDPDARSRWWSFPPTMPFSPYVLGLAAGPFHHLERQHGSTPIGLYCAPSLAPYLDSDELFDITGRGLEYFERVFGVAYPFTKYDQVFCPEKVNGAMESPGCVTLSDRYLYRGRPTLRQRSLRADTILHEMSHMWFGDLVTMRWWDDLWLNESFATLMAVFAVDQATDFDDAWVGFATVNLQLASEQDQLATSHPVVTQVADVESVRANFDRITYEKGAASLRQLVAYVGEENFFAAIHLYLTEHREGNADLNDLIEALALRSGRDVRGWSRAWLETVGINLLRCEIKSSVDEVGAPVAGVSVIQTASPGQPMLRPHRIRVGSFDWVGDRLARVGAVELDVEGPRTAVEELAGARRPPVLLPNDGGLSYAKIRLDPLSLASVEANLSAIAEPLARALIWDSCWDMVHDLELPAHRYAQLVTQHLAAEPDTTLVGTVLANFREATRRHGDPGRRPDLEARMAEVAWEVVNSSPAGSDRQATWLRGFIRLAASKEQVDRCRDLHDGRHLPEGIALDAELRWSLVSALAARGAAGAAEIAKAVEADPSSAGLVRAAAARAARPTATAKKWAWSLLSAEGTTLEEVRIVGGSFGGLGHEQLLLPYVKKIAQLFDTALSKRGGEYAVQLGTYLPYSLPPSEELANSCRDQLSRGDLDPILRRIFADILEDTVRLLRARRLDAVDGGLATGSEAPLTMTP